MSRFLKKINSRLVLIAGITFGVIAASFLIPAPSQAQNAPIPPFPSFATTTPASFSLAISPQIVFTGDKVTVNAVPDNFSASTTDFTWYRDGKVIAAASGMGRASLIIATDPTKQEIIQIKVQANPGTDFSPGEQVTAIYTLPSSIQQEETLSNISSSFSLQASNTNPDPGESVTVEVVTYAFDKQNAEYQWTVNGAIQRDLSGQGKYRITVPGGKEGEGKMVGVTVTTPSGIVRSDSVFIETASASFYWWANTAVPYWYKGKALPTLNSTVTAMALPNGWKPSSLNYQWQFNASPIPQSSGFGKQTFSFTLAFPVEERIDVTMKDVSGTFSKTKSVGIKPLAPSVGIYELRPLRGVVSERELDTFGARSGTQYDFSAVPFFFPRERAAGLQYTWTLNGTDITGQFTEPWKFTLTSNSGTESDNQLGVRISDSGRSGEQTSVTIQTVLHP